MTPYEIVYGQKPLSMESYVLGTSKVDAIDGMLQTKVDTIHTLKDNLY